MHHPLASPLSWPRSQPSAKYRSRNERLRSSTVASASVDIENEVRMLGGRDLALRIDGFPRSNQPEPSNPGAAVYFTRKGKPLVFACDRYTAVAQNLRAIAMHLEALRGMERWGVGTLDQAFAGYAALPEHASGHAWWSVLGLTAAPATEDELQAAYRDAARRAHPDTGGSHDAFVRVQAALQQGREALGGAA